MIFKQWPSGVLFLLLDSLRAMQSSSSTSGSCSTDIGGVGTGADLSAVGSSDNDARDLICSKPELEVLQDYDGYFGNYVWGLVQQKATSFLPFESKKIVVTSGPWRMYAISYERKDDTLFLDFYSPARFHGGLDAATDELLKEL